MKKTEAVVIIGNEKYFSRAGRFYHYDVDGKRTEITQDDYNAAIHGDREALIAQQTDRRPQARIPKRHNQPKGPRTPVKRELDHDLLGDIPGYLKMTEEEFHQLEPEVQAAKIHTAIEYTKPSLSQAKEVLQQHGTTASLLRRGVYSVTDSQGNSTQMTGPQLSKLAKDTVEKHALRQLGIENVTPATGADATRLGNTKKQQPRQITNPRQPREIQTYKHNLDINLDDTRQSDRTKKKVKEHFQNNIAQYLSEDDVEIDYSSAGAGTVFLDTTLGTTRSPVNISASVTYESDGTLTFDADVEDVNTGNSCEITGIPIRNPEDLEDMMDRCSRGIKDKWVGKTNIGLRDYLRQEQRMRALRQRNELKRKKRNH